MLDMKSFQLVKPAAFCLSILAIPGPLQAFEIFTDSVTINGTSTDLNLNNSTSQDWTIRSNSAGLSIRRGGIIPFLLNPNAATSAIYVDSDGDTALGTTTPNNDFNSRLHIEDQTPDIAFKTIPGGGITAQTWSLYAYDTEFGLCDETAYPQLGGDVLCTLFSVEKGAPVDSLAIRTSGFVGVGTHDPEEKLHVKDGNLKVEQSAAATNAGLNFATADSSWNIIQNGVTGRLTFFSPGGGALTASFKFDRQAQENLLRVGVLGKDIVDITGKLVINGSQVTPDYVFDPGYPLESIEEHAEFMWENKHLPALPGASANEAGVDIVSHQYGTLEELEKAHIYISQLNQEIKQLKTEHEKRIDQLEMALAEVLSKSP
jgi:hypothetical protein